MEENKKKEDINSFPKYKNSKLGNIIRATFLHSFLNIHLTSSERALAEEAIEKKYKVAIYSSSLYCLLLLPCLLLLDTQIVISVLIPTTMVAGTAWFSVSLASLKEKFADFGLELTVDLFNAFTLSLSMLFIATVCSLTTPLWIDFIQPLRSNISAIIVSSVLGIVVVGRLLFSIFSGSLRYDINDAMLTGQNEAAERYFKQSLSVLHKASQVLKTGRSLHVANYSIGVAFFEVFTDISHTSTGSSPEKINLLIEKANQLIKDPSMEETQANELTIELTESFLAACTASVEKSKTHKSTIAIEDELECLKRSVKLAPRMREKVEEKLQSVKSAASYGNSSELDLFELKNKIRDLVQSETPKAEDQEMTDLRISVVLDEVTNLVEEFGHLIVVS